MTYTSWARRAKHRVWLYPRAQEYQTDIYARALSTSVDISGLLMQRGFESISEAQVSCTANASTAKL